MKQLDDIEVLFPCVNCGGIAYHYPESDYQANAIYCEQCPLGVEDCNMTDEELFSVWNKLYIKVNGNEK